MHVYMEFNLENPPSGAGNIAALDGQQELLLLNGQRLDFLMRSDHILLLHHAVDAVTLCVTRMIGQYSKCDWMLREARGPDKYCTLLDLQPHIY